MFLVEFGWNRCEYSMATSKELISISNDLTQRFHNWVLRLADNPEQLEFGNGRFAVRNGVKSNATQYYSRNMYVQRILLTRVLFDNSHFFVNLFDFASQWVISLECKLCWGPTLRLIHCLEHCTLL